MNEMVLRRLSGVRIDQTTAAVVDRAEVLAGRAPDPSAVVEELIAAAEGRQFVLDAAYAVALRRHRDDTEPGLTVQLLEMADYTLQHRRRAGARTGRILSYINLLIHGSGVLVFLGITVWAARRAVVERDALLVVAVLFTALGSARLAYSIRKLTLFTALERSEGQQRAAIASDTVRPNTIPQLVADTVEAARQLAAQEAATTDPIEAIFQAARGGQTGAVAGYRAKVVLEEALRRASFIPPVRSLNRRVFQLLSEARRSLNPPTAR